MRKPCREDGGVRNEEIIGDQAGRAALGAHLAALREIAGG